MKCPKCGSRMEHNGLDRFGSPPVIWRCPTCNPTLAELVA